MYTTMLKRMAAIDAVNKILLIEDNPADARLVELFLGQEEDQEYQIIKAPSLSQGLQALKETKFSVVLLDLSLPDSQNFDTLERLIGQHPDANVIVMTGLEDTQVGIQAVKTGAQDYLVKGQFKQQDLSKSIRFSIERTRILKNLEETQRIAKIGQWEYHQESKYFEASKAVYSILGLNYKKGKVANVDLTDPNSPFHFLEKIHYDAIIDRVYTDDLEITRSDGSHLQVSIRCEVEQRTGRTHLFRGIIQDISARKMAEREVERQKERYHEIFSQSKDAIYICKFNGQLIDFNQATVNLFGSTRRELQKSKSIHPLFSPIARFEECLALIRDKQSITDVELTLHALDGRTLDVLISGSIY